MKELVIKLFPNLYILWQHYHRVKEIKRVNELKNRPESEYPELIKARYEEVTGKKLDWNNLVTYREKMQWAKAYDSTLEKARLADKYLVREWISEKIGEEYLIPLLGVWDRAEQIDFDLLPDKFVLKTNHSSGFNIIVKDKKNLNIKSVRSKLNDWLDIDFAFYNGFELHYAMINRKIIAEEYVENQDGELPDYKFMCFNGKPYYCYVDVGRFGNHIQYVMDMDWKLQPWNDGYFGEKKETPIKPERFDDMKKMAETLCEGYSHVRVDFYYVNGKIYFGEMTFTNGCGYDPILPEEYDIKLGELWKIS